jgi:hypothetical protein
MVDGLGAVHLDTMPPMKVGPCVAAMVGLDRLILQLLCSHAVCSV